MDKKGRAELKGAKEKTRQMWAAYENRADKVWAMIDEYSKENDEGIARMDKMIAESRREREEMNRAVADMDRATVSMLTDYVSLAHTVDTFVQSRSQVQASTTSIRRRPCRGRGQISHVKRQSGYNLQ